MLIAFCIFKYFPYGGIPRDLMKLVRECRSRGHRVRVYAARWEAPPPAPADLELVEIPARAWTNHRRYERFAAQVHEHLREHPVDLVVGMNKMPGLDAYYAGDSCFAEKALTQRGALYRLLPRYEHFRRFERAVFDPAVATEILTISNVQVPYFRKHYGTPPARFHPLPPGIDRDRSAPPDCSTTRAELRAEFGLGEDDLLLLFIGSGFIKKGLDRALRALQALPHHVGRRTRLFVVGHDRSEPFRRMAKRLGVYRRVRFLDGRDDVPRFLFGADGLVLPAYDENAGMVILEAMIAGLPALVTRNCGYAHYLEQAGAGLVADSPFDQHAFNDQLAELLTSSRRAEWSRNGRALADDPEIHQLAPRAVDHLERIAARRRPVVAFQLFKYFAFGGLQRDFMKVALAIRARGYLVRVYTLSWEGEIPDGFEIVRVRAKGIVNHRRYRRFARWVANDLAWRPVACVVGFNKLPGLDVYYAADPCFEEKARELRQPMYRWMPRYRTFARFERAVFGAGADTDILLITPRQRAAFRHYYGTADERMRVLPPGVSPDRKRPPDAAELRRQLREEFGVAPTQLLLLLIGSGFITKGLDRALLAIAALPPELRDSVRFFAIGEDNPRQFLALAVDLGIGRQVTIFRGRDDIPRFLQGADLMLHPAYLESGGIVLLEAAIAGLPVIATDVCGFAPYIEEAQAGIVIRSPFCQQDLNRRLADALRDPVARARWSRAGVAFGERADLYGMAERAADLIEERIGGKTVPA